MLTTSVDVPVDRSLAALEVCLDTTRVLEACRVGLSRIDASTRASWSQAHMIEAMYHPHRYVRVVYALSDDVTIPANRVWPEGQIIYLHAPVRTPMSRRGTILDLNGEQVEAYSFPNDRRLRGLRSFAGREACVTTWETWLHAADDKLDVDGETLQRLLVRYVPEQKWLVRLRAEVGAALGGERRKRRLAVRATTPSACVRLHRRHRMLAQQHNDLAQEFVFPDVVGCDETRGLLGVEWLRGQSLIEALQETDPQEIMSNIVRRLRSLHAVRVDDLKPMGFDCIVDRVTAAADDLSAVCPDLSEDIGHIVRAIEQKLSACQPSSPVTLHNDFHWNQLSIKRDRYALFDPDRMALGDPLVDVANFATEIAMLGDRPEFDFDPLVTERWRTTFLEEWATQTDCRIDAELFSVFACLSRLELARGMLRHLRPGWCALARRCVVLNLQDLANPPGCIETT